MLPGRPALPSPWELCASAFRGGENKRVMSGDLKDAIGGVGNAYAITTLWATVMLIPAIFISGEYAKLDVVPRRNTVYTLDALQSKNILSSITCLLQLHTELASRASKANSHCVQYMPFDM